MVLLISSDISGDLLATIEDICIMIGRVNTYIGEIYIIVSTAED